MKPLQIRQNHLNFTKLLIVTEPLNKCAKCYERAVTFLVYIFYLTVPGFLSLYK